MSDLYPTPSRSSSRRRGKLPTRRIAPRVEGLEDRQLLSLVWNSTNLSLSNTRIGASVTPNGNFFASDGFNIKRSSDQGKTWSTVSASSSFAGGAIAYAPSNAATMLAGRDYGTMKSVDGGSSWFNEVDINAGEPAFAIAFQPNNELTVYAGVGYGWGLYKSTNGGSTWTNPITSRAVAAIAIDPSNPGVVYAGTETYSSSADGLLKSTDSGATWATVLPNKDVSSVLIDPANSQRIYAGTTAGAIFKSLDGGATWNNVSGSTIAAPISALAFDPQNSAHVWASTSGQGLYYSGDGGATWAADNAGLTDLNVVALSVQPVAPYEMLAVTYGGKGYWASIASSDTTPPTVSSIARLTPSAQLTNTATATYSVTFSEHVNNVSATDFTLVDVGNAITGESIASVSASSGTSINVTVNTGTAGTSDLRLDVLVPGATITDDAGNALNASFTSGQVFTVDHTAPTVASLAAVTPNPRTTGLASEDVTFSEPIDLSTFDAGDLTLTRDGAAVALQGATTGLVSGSTYRISGLSDATSAAGSYVLAVSAAGIKDPAGNLGTGSVATSWVRSAGGTLGFSPASVYAVGQTIGANVGVSVATGDINRDGKRDIATGNFGPDSISYFPGNGAGTFPTRTDIQTGRYYGSIALGDLNADGKLDLVLPDLGDYVVSVLLGRGDGTFAPKVDYNVGITPTFVVIADFNRDGKPDLAVAHSSGISTVTLALGNGDGTFQAARQFDAGGSSSGVKGTVAVGDFNRDGNLDLAVANHDSSNVGVLLGDGKGSFGAPLVLSPLERPTSIAVADLNGDGNPDLVTGSVQNHLVNVFLGDGAGHFGPAVGYGAGATDGYSHDTGLAVSDFDGDGITDVAAVNDGLGSAFVLRGDGQGGLRTAASFGLGFSSYEGGFSVTAADLNADSEPDLVVGCYGSNKISVLLNSTTVTPPTVTSVGPVSPNPRNVPVSTVNVTWSAPIDLTTFDSNDLTLTRGGAAVPLTSAVTISLVSGSTYRIGGLSGFTGSDGTYALTVNATGVKDTTGTAGTGSASTNWVMDTVAPTVSSIVRLSPAAPPTNAATATYRVTFSEPVVNVSAADFTLVDVANAITGEAISSVSASSGTSIDVTVSTGTAGDGDLRLDLVVPGATIQDNAGNALVASYTTGQVFTIDRTAPTVVDVVDVAPDPRTTPVTDIDIVFSEPISLSTLTYADLGLTRDGSPVALDGTVTTRLVAGSTYRVSGLGGFTAAPGTYSLTAYAAGILDVAGNAGTGNGSDTWVTTSAATGVIRGNLYADQNGSGARDAGEPGVTGWTVFLDANQNGVLDAGEASGTTDASGNYQFTGLGAGPYRVAEVLPAGWRQTAPGGVGPEFRVNTTIVDTQLAPAIATAPDGRSVVVWQHASPSTYSRTIMAQRYDASGAPQGPEITVFTFDTAASWDPAVAMDAQGNFVVVWATYGLDGDAFGIFGQRFDASGVAQGGRFQVNADGANDQSLPSIAMDAAGNFAVIWETRVIGSGTNAVRYSGRRFSAAGVPEGGDFVIADATSDGGRSSSIAMDAAGDFVVAWQDGGPSFNLDVFAQRYNVAGVAQGGRILVNTTTADHQFRPSVGMDALGNFAVAWISSNQGGNPSGLYARRFTAAGVARGPEFVVSTAATGIYQAPRLAMDPAGNFAITWAYPIASQGSPEVYARRYDANEAALGGEFQVNTTTAGAQQEEAAALGPNGSLVVVWSSEGQDPDGSQGIYARRLASTDLPTPYLVALTDGQTIAGRDFGNLKFDTTGPSLIDVIDVSPDPRTTPVSTVDVVFSEPIDLSTFTVANVALTRDGNPVVLSSAVTTSLVSGSTYRINGLDAFTAAAGTYVLTVNAAGAKDPAGNVGTGTASDQWAVTAPMSSGITFLSQATFGGSGDEQGTGIAAVDGSAYRAYLVGNSPAAGGDGLLVSYGPPDSAGHLASQWNRQWPGADGYDWFGGVAATATDVYAAGQSYSHTTDNVGDKEDKGITVDFAADGSSIPWDRQTPGAPGAFSYGGGETLRADAVAVEGGQTYIYATGNAQSGFYSPGRLFLSKLDATGHVLWTQTDPATNSTQSYGARVVAQGGAVYVAGVNADSGTARAYIKKYDPSGNLLWAKTSAAGQFNGLTVDASGGAIYAVGQTNGSSPDFLVERWDLNGNVAWSKSYDRGGAEDILNGVALVNSQLFAVGSTRGSTAGGSDGVVLQLDPATGALVQTTLWGGAADDSFTDAAATANRLHVVGTTRSFGAGGSDVAYVVYNVGPSAAASFLKTDAATQGSWESAYGADGSSVVGDAAQPPAYATVTPSGQQSWTWAASTTDARALQKAAGPDRVAATWYASSSFTVDLNLTDGKTHRVAAYFLDWDTAARSERVDVVDPGNGAVLDTRTIASFHDGLYLVWNLSGHVQLRITRIGGANAVLSGLFFGDPQPTGGAASFLKTDAATQGSWKSAYGADGSSVVGDAAQPPAYATVTPSGQQSWTWAASTTDARALQKSAAGPTDRVAATWYAATSFTIDLNLTDGQAHQVAAYFLDWDGQGRSERVEVLDAASGSALDTRDVATFSGGTYLVWTLSGHVQLRVTRQAGPNAVLSGLFFGGAPTTGISASFVKLDATTRGTWKGAYGADGYNVLGDAAPYPAYATVAAAGQQSWTWAASTTDARALQKSAAGSTDRVAATWYAATSFTIDLNLTDGQAHQLALYALDWDGQGRSERVEVLDAASGSALDTRDLTSFSGGTYLVWNLRGHVQIRVTRQAGPNAVASGLFFGPSS